MQDQQVNEAELAGRNEQQRKAMDTQFSKFILKPKPGELRLVTEIRGYSP